MPDLNLEMTMSSPFLGCATNYSAIQLLWTLRQPHFAKPACTELMLQMMMTSLRQFTRLMFMTFIFSPISLILTKPDRIVDQRSLFLICRYDDFNTTGPCMTNINDFISPSISPITTKIERMVDQSVLVLTSMLQ